MAEAEEIHAREEQGRQLATIPSRVNERYLPTTVSAYGPPGTGKTLTPLGFALGVIVLAVGVFRFQLLDIVPAARRTLVESLDDAVFVLDSEGRIVGVNAAGRSSPCLHPEVDEPVGQPLQSVLRDEIAMQPALEDGTAEYTLRVDGDQRHFWARETAITRRGAGGTSLLTVTDVTERRQRERELKQTRDRLESFIEASPVAILAVDSDGDVTLWNSAAEEIFEARRTRRSQGARLFRGVAFTGRTPTPD